MKKIIYSLVIMIAAGSLFTSCIEQVEPLGIQDMRYAKAEYIRALKDLRAADAEYVRAQAAHEQARARYVDAMTANLNADTEYQLLLNEYQELLNAAREDTNEYIAASTLSALDKIKKEMELRELKHQKRMVEAQQELAEAQEKLRVALRNIALACQDLTTKEKEAVLAAVAAYGIAFEAEAEQEIVVLQAQRKLDSLLMVREHGAIDTSEANSTYDASSKAYIGQVDKWKKEIEEAEALQAIVAALLVAVPDSLVYDDIDGWKEQIDKLVEDSTALEYNRYQVKMEMANYYTNYIHDGVTAFNNKVKEFKAENWIDGVTEPTFTAADSATIAKGEPKQDDFKMGNADTIEMPVLNYKVGFAYNRFKAMLDPYFKAFNNQAATGKYKVDGKNVVMLKDNGTNLKLYAKQAWKDFILGTDKGTVESQVYVEGDTVKIVADYGLKGAVSVLERRRVYEEAEATNYADSLAKYKKIWNTNREILTTVNKAYFAVAEKKRVAIGNATDSLYMKSYEPYAEALKTLNEKKAALNSKLSDSSAVAQKMTDAVANFVTAYNNHINGGTWSTADSTQMLKAVVDFAAARKEYFSANGLNTDTLKFLVEDQHPDYLHYLSAGNPKTMDSIEIVKLDMKELRKTVTMDNRFGASVEFCKYGWFWEDGVTPYGPDTAPTVFHQIFQQVFNDDVVAKLTAATTIAESEVATLMNGGDRNAFYGQFKYYASTTDDPAYFVNAQKYPTESAMPEKAKAERKAVKDAQDALDLARQSYKDVYKSYWGTNDYVSDNKPGSEVKATSYTDTTFVEPFPIVYFNEAGTAVDTTTGLATVLQSIDAQTTPRKVLGDNAATHSDFWNYMKWLDKVGTIDEDELNLIKEWVSGVEHAFALDAEAAAMPDTAAYQLAKEAYDDAVANKKAYDEYIVAKKAFTGVDKDGNPNEIVTLTKPSVVDPGEKFDKIKSVVVTKLVEKNIYDDYTGEWNEKLGGKQLEAAKEIFPEYPAKVKAWDEEIKKVNDQLKHYQFLIDAAKEAYFASAKVADELVKDKDKNDPTNWDQLVANYKAANKRYRTRLTNTIIALQGVIDANEQSIALFNTGLPQLDIAIARAENELRVEKEILKDLKQALSYAKENLDRILEYMKSLDGVNFVIPDFTTPTSTTTLP